VRWGVGDFVWVYFSGLLIATVAAQIGIAISGDTTGHIGAFTTALATLGQFGGWAAGLVLVSRRKGRGSLAADFGLTLELKRMWALAVGVGLSVVLGLMVYPIVSLANFQKQQVVDDLKNASGAKLAVFVIVAALIAPVAEELLFRGLLLRALRRRMAPELAVGLQALIFALAHPALDPHIGTLAVVPALFALGAISGIFAVRYGDLSASIPLHIGFNLLTVAQYAVILRHF
jgi:uncharacterized protein